jgi:transcriptional regulator with XRE-family HTH domain
VTHTENVATVLQLPDPEVDGLRRQELGSFLRSRRERVTPEQVGLRTSRRRRTPGLRREEVAQIAGVGVTWYTWLEQGREINASAQVLDAIARALLFDDHERAHLFTLAATSDPASPSELDVLPPGTQDLLDQLEPYPALVVNARYDVLAYNRMWVSGFPFLESLPREERNCLWLLFTHPSWRDVLVDWEGAARRMVGNYRAAMADHVGDPSWNGLVARLEHASPDFGRMWALHDVQDPETYLKEFRHPEIGLLRMNFTSLWFGQRRGVRLSTYTPADGETRARLEALHARIAVTPR